MDGVVFFYFFRKKDLKKIVGSNNFSAQFIKIISHYKKIGYNIKVYGTPDDYYVSYARS